MPQDQNNLIWLDMEMSGLDPERERIIEVALVVTNANLETVAEAPVWVIHQSDELLDAMDDWNKNTHGKSGLIDRVRASTLTEAQVEDEIIRFLELHVPKGVSPLCGNSVHQDRRFIVKFMPRLDQYLHYRIIDVSVLKELCKRWRPEVYARFQKEGKHEALADIYESIEEMKFYRENFLKMAE
ncbi:oligoribonuclease [Formivibrio citricus]|uniref:Oligoribonuclease n=1 Tax=Formivibrio citricus TaxID=83765 RepID=A0A1I4XB31_9NEIS|nr:oligoribonuclease [Formivibrio citricus]SFN22703.1 oligoribonuclease [Formivibrio citricus]